LCGCDAVVFGFQRELRSGGFDLDLTAAAHDAPERNGFQPLTVRRTRRKLHRFALSNDVVQALLFALGGWGAAVELVGGEHADVLQDSFRGDGVERFGRNRRVLGTEQREGGKQCGCECGSTEHSIMFARSVVT
jgi:hypothetical protein